MTDIEHVVERLRQIAESQRMDFDSPNVAMTLDESANALESLAAERDLLRAERSGLVQSSKLRAERRAEKADAERDALRAIIDEALAFPADDVKYDGGTLGARMRRILSRATTEEGAD